MEELLSVFDAWVGAHEATPVIDAASVAVVRERVRSEAARAGLDEVRTASLVNVASELANNQLVHARGRRAVVVRGVSCAERRGVEVMAADEGDGIADVARALEGLPRRQGSLGVGLAAVSELADEVDFDVRLGEGTCVRARKFDEYSTRGRRVGVFGRAYPGERVSGDDATFACTDVGLLFAVADGLGHGERAREASARAMNVVSSGALKSLERLCDDVDDALRETRGAVMVAGRLETERVDVAGVGNVTAHLYGVASSRRFTGTSFVLGARGAPHRPVADSVAFGPRDVLVVCTDGIRSGLDLRQENDLLREHPIVIAQRVVERFARPDDDVLVMVIG